MLVVNGSFSGIESVSLFNSCLFSGSVPFLSAADTFSGMDSSTMEADSFISGAVPFLLGVDFLSGVDRVVRATLLGFGDGVAFGVVPNTAGFIRCGVFVLLSVFD